jgi:hypothetical protein
MKSPWMSALTDRMNLATLGIAIAAGLLAAWWLLPVGLIVWAIMMILTAKATAAQP